MKYISISVCLLLSSCSLLFCTACNEDQTASDTISCHPQDINAIASGQFIDIEDGPLCFYATELESTYLHYRLNRDGNTGLELPLVPWSTIFLEIRFNGIDDQESHFAVHLRNSILDSLDAFTSAPIPLTAELVVDRLLTPGEYPIVGRGLNSIGYDARVDFSNNRFGGYSSNSRLLPPDAGSITIIASELRTAADGEQFIDIELSFGVRIRQFYDENSWRDIQNGHLAVSIPVADLIPD